MASSRRRYRLAFAPTLALLVTVWWSVRHARGDLVLTAAGSAEGFTLTTFATGFPNLGASGGRSAGPLGIAFTDAGGVLVADLPGNVRLFSSNADGQVASSAPIGHNYGVDNALGIAKTGGLFYMTEQSAGSLVQINPDGTPTGHVILSGLGFPNGIAANPLNGHLFVSDPGNGHILDVDPMSGFSRVITNATVDGITTDGRTIYSATGSQILGFRASDGVQVYSSPTFSGIPDGIALGYGSLAGELFVNTNGGDILRIVLGTGAITDLATGGSRGDFVAVAPDGTLLVTQTDRIMRLTAPPGGSFATPEPSSVALFGSGGLFLMFLTRRSHRLGPRARA